MPPRRPTKTRARPSGVQSSAVRDPPGVGMTSGATPPPFSSSAGCTSRSVRTTGDAGATMGRNQRSARTPSRIPAIAAAARTSVRIQRGRRLVPSATARGRLRRSTAARRPRRGPCPSGRRETWRGSASPGRPLSRTSSGGQAERSPLARRSRNAFISSALSTAGMRVGSFGVATRRAGLSRTSPSRAQNLKNDRREASLRASERFCSLRSCRWPRNSRMMR